jgi:hypothetical protein
MSNLFVLKNREHSRCGKYVAQLIVASYFGNFSF